MSEHRSRRSRRHRQEDRRNNATNKTPITILAKRDDGNDPKLRIEVKPKILQRAKVDSKKEQPEDDEKDTTSSGEGSSRAPPQPTLQKTLIITRSDVNAARSAQCSPARVAAGTIETLNAQMSQLSTQQEPEVMVNKMTRPATVISSTGLVNTNTKKVLHNHNTDFYVVGVVGTQGVGKSTILNLLANESNGYDYFQKVFVDQDVPFPTKLKPIKGSGRSRTESTHMFITTNRLILLDSPPVMCNSYRKDMITSEVDDLRNIVTMMSVCHLLIVVQDDYFNTSFLRLLQQAEWMKAPLEGSTNDDQYFPNLMFVKNRAKHRDFEQGQREMINELLIACFKDSECRIFKGETLEQQKQLLEQEEQRQKELRQRMKDSRSEGLQKEPREQKEKKAQDQQQLKKSHIRTEFVLNSFLIPEVSSPDSTPYHGNLKDIIDDFRALVFMSPRNAIKNVQPPNEFNEAAWFDLLTRSAQEAHNHLFECYESSQSKLYDATAADSKSSRSGGAKGGGVAVKDIESDWQDELM